MDYELECCQGHVCYYTMGFHIDKELGGAVPVPILSRFCLAVQLAL